MQEFLSKMIEFEFYLGSILRVRVLGSLLAKHHNIYVKTLEKNSVLSVKLSI